MRLMPGQATRKAARDGAVHAVGRAGRLVHGLIQLVVVLFIVGLVGITVLAIRLAQGPLPLAGIARQIAAAASSSDHTLTIGGAELTWEGLHGGIDRPIDLVLRDVVMTKPSGQTELSVSRAEVSLSLIDLLLGRAVLRAVALDQPELNLDLAVGGDADAAPGSDTNWRASLAKTLQALRLPATHARDAPALLAQLRRVRLTNAKLALHDNDMGVRGNLSDVSIDLLRGAAGGASFHLSATLNLGGGQVKWRTTGELLASSGDIVMGLAVDRFEPSWLASDMDALAPLNIAQLPLTLSGTTRLDPHLALKAAALDISAERGTLLLGDGALPLRRASLHADIKPDQLQLSLREAVLQATDASHPTHVSAQINAQLHTGADKGPQPIAADMTVDIDQVAVDDLPALWPLGLGGPGTRPWLVENAHKGTLSHAHVAVNLTAPEDFSDATVTHLAGGIDGNDISISWLSPVPPVEHSSGHLVFVDPDTMDIILTGGQQAGTALVTNQGKLRMTGLAGHDQFLALEMNLNGPFADVIRLLNHKRIRLLEKGNMVVTDPTGQITGRMTVNLPLKNSLEMDEVIIHATGQLADAHIGGIAGGRDINHATLNFDVGNDGLTLGGTAEIANIPAQIAAALDFRPGGAAEIVQKVDVNSSFTADELAARGANPDKAFTGGATARLTYTQRRGGRNELGLAVDFTKLAITDSLLTWSKTADTPGQLSVHAELKGDQLVSVDRISADAPGLTLRAHAQTLANRPSILLIDTLKLGETTSLSGSLNLPMKEGDVTEATLSGPALDVSGLLAHHNSDDTKRGPPYRLDLHVDRVTMAGGNVWKNLSAQLQSDGWITNQADVTALAGAGKMALHITQQPSGRSLHATAEDAGAMLGALDISQRVADGSLLAEGRYDDKRADHRLTGTATMENFRIRDAPAIARLLQALSVYGIFEAASGSGLGFNRMTAPFELTSHTLTLDNARAISASLGFTAKGAIDLDARSEQIEGTVIPLYFFNSLLGRLPLVGKLFSPEKEGGLLAVGFSIRGNMEDPSVTVNPLSALTPGFLRGFFDLFPPSTVVAPTPAPNQ